MCGDFVGRDVVRPVRRCIQIWIASHRIKKAEYLVRVRKDESLVKTDCVVLYDEQMSQGAMLVRLSCSSRPVPMQAQQYNLDTAADAPISRI